MAGGDDFRRGLAGLLLVSVVFWSVAADNT
jgi:hypothetical protein